MWNELQLDAVIPCLLMAWIYHTGFIFLFLHSLRHISQRAWQCLRPAVGYEKV